MSRFVLIGRYVRSLFAVISAAKAVSNAVAMRHAPSAAALKTLGIDPETFRAIRYV
ncbi:MAG TPA: hypothetical protein VGQ35_12900 [Dongiaceae bacterium]|jgi:hypothetical protein|nr:hypothetical protein [Dongiaceae bacterium]